MNTSTDIYKNLPKVDLHRHLEGCLRLETLFEIAHSQGILDPVSIENLSRFVQVQPGEPCTYQNFLAKFIYLRKFYRSPEVIHRITREAVEDAALDNVRYLELRFTPVSLSCDGYFLVGDVMDWVCESASTAGKELGLQVRLIVSVNRHESVELAEKVALLTADRIGCGILGLDLAGNEAEFSAVPFAGVFKEAHQAGLKLTVHAGEWAGVRNVREALETLQAERIGHGVRILEDPNTMAMARDLCTPFEVCVTSNFQTGVTHSLQEHPLMKMLDFGLNVVLCTDDPSISQITLTNEYFRVCNDLGLELKTLKECILAAAQASFLPNVERETLVAELSKELSV